MLQLPFIRFCLLLHQSLAALLAQPFVGETCGSSLQTVINCAAPKPKSTVRAELKNTQRCRNNYKSHERGTDERMSRAAQVWPGEKWKTSHFVNSQHRQSTLSMQTVQEGTLYYLYFHKPFLPSPKRTPWVPDYCGHAEVGSCLEQSPLIWSVKGKDVDLHDNGTRSRRVSQWLPFGTEPEGLNLRHK